MRKPQRFFYDTEFLEDGSTMPIDLISIGMVAEDGRKLYLVNRDADWRRIRKNDWLMANVVPKLPQPHGDWILHMPKPWLIDFRNPAVVRRPKIAEAVERFLLGDDLAGGHADAPEVELWADYAAYDHVALCQLFGRMVDLPPGIPMFTNDLQQEWRRAGRPTLPEQASGAHNALDDALHLKACFEVLAGQCASTTRPNPPAVAG